MENNNSLANGNKRIMVESMFDSIAWRYDFLNHFLSFGVDNRWRKRAIRIISQHYRNPSILDVATGTGDLAIAAMKLNPVRITGIDISRKMLEIGRIKLDRKGLSDRIELLQSDSEKMPFRDETFDVAMVAFGVRNFSDPLNGLKEMNRVIRNDGMIMVLEFSRPEGFLFSKIYNLYFRRILPAAGKLISGDRGAYKYLPESVGKFPDNKEFIKLLVMAGFTQLDQFKLSRGIASIYTGFKKSIQ